MEKQKESKKLSELAVVEVSKDGMLAPKNMAGLWQVAQVFVKSGLLPNHFNSTEKAFVGLQVCSELGIKPITGMKHLYIVNGSPALYGDLPLAMVRNSGLLEYIKESIVDKNMNEICVKNKNLNEKPYAAICIGKRKEEEEKEYFFTIEDAEHAGLFKNYVWKTFTRDMLKHKPRSRFLKDNFSDVLLGIPLMESDFDILPENQQMKDITGMAGEIFTNPTDQLNNDFEKKEKGPEPIPEPVKTAAKIDKKLETTISEVEKIDTLQDLYNFKVAIEKQKIKKVDKELILAAIEDRQTTLEKQKESIGEEPPLFDEGEFDL